MGYGIMTLKNGRKQHITELPHVEKIGEIIGELVFFAAHGMVRDEEQTREIVSEYFNNCCGTRRITQISTMLCLLLEEE